MIPKIDFFQRVFFSFFEIFFSQRVHIFSLDGRHTHLCGIPIERSLVDKETDQKKEKKIKKKKNEKSGSKKGGGGLAARSEPGRVSLRLF